MRTGKAKRLYQTNRGGYRNVHLRAVDGRVLTRAVHRLVLFAFVGPCPDGMECAHANRNRADNRLENLSWSTPFGNYLDKVRHGTVYQGERQHSAKLNSAKVVEIRQLLSAGVLHKEIAARFGVAPSTIGSIASGVTWKHVPTDVDLRRNKRRDTKCDAKSGA